MAPIALGTKHQDLLKAYIQVSKTSGADWTTIATKADYPTSKYARDQWALVKSKLLATDNGTAINLADRQIALLKATIEVMKTEVCSSTSGILRFLTMDLLTNAVQTDWEKVASVANVKTSKYARDQFAIIRNKLCGGGKAKSDTASPSETPAKAKTTKATPSRKRKKSEGASAHDQHSNIDRTNKIENADDEDEDRTSQPSASADEVSTPAKKTKKVRKLKVDEAEREAEEEGGEEPVAPIVQEQQLEASSHDDAKLEPESDEQEESFFEAEMFHMQ